MAKKIQVSDDAQVTWHTLPGASGEFALNGEPIPDTILGQTFESNEAGLINWSVSAEALWKGFAGYQAKLKQVGTATNATSEACTLVSGKIYQIDATTKRIWDRSAAVVVYDNAVDHTADVVDIDYLFGKVTFDDAYTVTGTVTVDVDFFPTVAFANAKSFTLTQTANPIDDTTFSLAQSNGGYNEFEPGLRTVQLELAGIYDAATGVRTQLTDREEIIIEIDPAGDGSSIARGFFKIMGQTGGGEVGALEEENITASLNVPSDELISTVFSWEHAVTTTMPEATKIVLTAWETETKIDCRYLPSGAPGESPLDGFSGVVMLQDVSLTSGLSDMNKFAASIQGSGALTVI